MTANGLIAACSTDDGVSEARRAINRRRPGQKFHSNNENSHHIIILIIIIRSCP